jgi:nucleotidyltransferase/DNA polymerase involved in DNA repair
MKDTRKLSDLVSVGKSFEEIFHHLGITTVDQLVDQDAEDLYSRLQHMRGERMDICCQDVFRAAIEQAKKPDLPKEQCQWHYWSRVRKADK